MALNSFSKASLVEKRYILHEKIGTGGMGSVYRATDRLVGQDVALKRVTATQDKLAFRSQSQSMDLNLALANEFHTLASLRHPHIVSVLDYGFDNSKQPFFTMDLLENPRNIIDGTKGLKPDAQVELLIQLLQALSYLHRRGILHRDLKPGNVMVVDKKVKVLDFGLAVSHDYELKENATPNEAIVGTLAYISPEVLSSKAATTGSDLYALGIMAYEIFAGRHPFNTHNLNQLLIETLTVAPDLDALDVNEGIRNIIGGLLEKDQNKRFSDAQLVLELYAAQINRKGDYDNAAIRESFLQGARFVGREAESNRLREALQNSWEAQTSSWLIGGESGVGKSRLLDELRSFALVNGTLVARGIAVSEGASLYQVWRDILRLLALNSDLSIEDASLLKLVIPDIDSLLGLETLRPPELDPKQIQAALFRSVTSIIERIQRPMLLILEDLHWAGSESIALLAHITKVLTNKKLLILGNYRDDENAELPKQLPAMQLMKLERLTDESIAQLSESILGKVGRDKNILNVLQRESEGNVFFLVEIVRTLAEEAGDLQQIGRITLPNNLYAGGVQKVIERRLKRVPEKDHRILQLMAIIGRQIDTKLIAALSPETNLEEWLSTCSNLAILNIQNENWYFAHDKLREGILADLSEDERKTMHREVAVAIEQVYQNAETHHAILAYHYLQVDDTAKVLQYSTAAADQSMKLGANAEAKRFYEQALSAIEKLEQSAKTRREMIEIVLKLARVSAFNPTENVPIALKDALTAAETLQDEALRTRVIASTGAFNYMLGKFGEAFSYFSQSIELAEKLNLEDLLILPYNILGRNMMLAGDWEKAETTLEKGIRILKATGQDLELLAGSQAFYAAVRIVQGHADEGMIQGNASLDLARELALPSRIAGNLMVLGFAHSMAGQYDAALNYLQESLSIATVTNDFHPLYMSHGCMGYVYSQRREMDNAATHLAKAAEITAKAALLPYVPLFRASRASLSLVAGDWDKALAEAEEGLELAEKASQKTSKAEIFRILSKIYLNKKEKDWEKAEAYLLQAHEIHQSHGAETLLTKTLFDLASFYTNKGDKEKAMPYLQQAESLSKKHRMDWYTKEIQALI